MLLVYFILFLLSCTSSSVSSSKDDGSVLLKIKEQLGNPPQLYDWVEGFDYCHHIPSVMCSITTGRVSHLYLQYFGDAVEFPDAICQLTGLVYLFLMDSPGFYGEIPSCVAKLPNLVQLQITDTSFSGSLPHFRDHEYITRIYAYDNKFNGTIPASLATCRKLIYLDASSNYLTGSIPPGLGISTLILSNNKLTGEIPTSYGSLNFERFDVGSNQLCGDASFLFGKQKASNTIVLAHNNFAFDPSYVEFSNNLVILDLSHNNIYGNVLYSIVEAARLRYLNLSFNKLCGEIPQGGSFYHIPEIFSNNSCLCGFPLPPCSSSGPALPPAEPVPVPVPPF